MSLDGEVFIFYATDVTERGSGRRKPNHYEVTGSKCVNPKCIESLVGVANYCHSTFPEATYVFVGGNKERLQFYSLLKDYEKK